MSLAPGAASRRLLLRWFVLLAVSLIAIAFVLNYVFARAFPHADAEAAALRDTVRELLAKTATPGEALALTVNGQPVTAVALDATMVGGHDAADFVDVNDANGQRYWLIRDASGARIWRVGPIPQRRFHWSSLLPPLFYLSIVVVLLVWLRPLLKDLDLLTAAAQRFARDSRQPLATRAEVGELTSLAENLDRMSARISALIDTQAAMTSALSHEIRTPLARMRFALAIDGHVAMADADRAALNADIGAIDRLVDAMLEYARLDDAGKVIERTCFDASDWLSATAVPVTSGDLRVDTRISPPDLSVDADPTLLELALSNLVSNAERYAERRISITLAGEPGTFRLLVEDDGPGIEPQDRARVLDAFRQAGPRASSGSFGLGLAVVRRVAELHGGGVSIGSSVALGGCSVALHWPAA